jgi:undecaprenyl-diphosphatase
MLEKLLTLDTQLFIYLNGLGSETYDGLWLIITKQVYWIPFFLVLLYLIYTKIGIKKTAYLLLFVAVLVLVTDQVTNLVKYAVQRVRPCNNPEINTFIRVVQSRTSFSFFSGHAANTMAVASFLYLIFRKQFKCFWLLFLWPLIFAYSRIYLGLHYPVDILSGYLFGLLMGYLMYSIYQFTQIKYFPL